jgi:hypothetical protein
MSAICRWLERDSQSVREPIVMLTSTTTVLINASQFQTLISALHSESFWNTQLFAAVVGAFLGLMPSLYLLYQDRPRIKVKIDQIFVPYTTPGISHVDTGFSVSIYNTGRRAINLKNIYLGFKDGESLVFINESNFVGGRSGLPKSLGENDSHTVAILASVVAQTLREKQMYPVKACYADAVGNVYPVKTSKAFWDKVFRLAEGDSKA